MASQTFVASATTPLSSDEVWAELDKSETWERITGVEDVFDEIRGQNGHLEGFKFYMSLGGKRYAGVASPGGREKGQSLAWDISTSEIKGSITVTLKSSESTVVEVGMRVESVSMMATMAFPFIGAAIGSGFQTSVDDFVAGLAD